MKANFTRIFFYSNLCLLFIMIIIITGARGRGGGETEKPKSVVRVGDRWYEVIDVSSLNIWIFSVQTAREW